MPQPQRSVVRSKDGRFFSIPEAILKKYRVKPDTVSAVEVTDSAIVVNSFSKYFSMTGWRVGWLVVPPDLVRPIDAASGIPAHDPITMATPLPGLYLAGVIASGNQANRIFIENGRDHGEQIVAHLRSL